MIVAMSDAIELSANALRFWLNNAPSAWLCLFTNDIPLSPDTENVGSYVEASYPGYARFGTVGLWAPVVRANPGVYYTQAGPFTFAINAGTAPIAVYGWFLLRGSRVVFAETIPGGPVIIAHAVPGPTLLVQLTPSSQSVTCPPI